VHLDARGQAQFLSYRTKILQPAALQLGNIVLAWRPPVDSPIVHEIKIYRDGQVIDALKDAKFEVLRREDQLEAASLDGTLTAVFHLPDLRVGDELEVSLTVFNDIPTLRPNESGLLFLNAAPAPGRYHLGLSWNRNRKLSVKMTADMAKVVAKSDEAMDFRFDNPPVLTPPSQAPPRFAWQRVIQYSDYSDWSALSGQLAQLFYKAEKLENNSPLKLEASRIAASNGTAMQRANAALKLVQQDVRYVYVGLNGGNLVPTSADETWRRRYGDCKAKTALLLALLTELNIKAEPVVVNSAGADDGLDQRLPLVDVFDHVLVRATIDGSTYWLDGTLPAVARASLKPVYPLKWVLPLTAAGSPLEEIPWQPAKAPEELTLYEIDARAGFDKPAKITVTEIARGLKGLQQQVTLSALSTGQLRELMIQQGGGGTFQNIDDVTWKYDEATGASILKTSGTGKVDWDDDGGGARSLALPGGGFNPPERRTRASGQDPDAPFYNKPEYTCSVTTVRVPENALKGHWSAKPDFDQYFFGRVYHRAFDFRDGAVRMVRGSRVSKTEIDVATALRDDGRIPAFDNSMGYISYSPEPGKSDVGKGELVPSTYDFDWTAVDVPCLQTSSAR
jgi:transglutaminase-like putative cysteine protease